MIQTSAPTLVSNADRTAAIRLALGAALAHEVTANLSNRELASRIGCGETTVRRYRKIANATGLTGSIATGQAPIIKRVEKTMASEAWENLVGVFDVTEGIPAQWALRMNARAKAYLALLDSQPSDDEVRTIYAASVQMTDDAEYYLP